VHGDLDAGDPFRLVVEVLRLPGTEVAGEDSFEAPRHDGFRAVDAAVRALAARIEAPGPPAGDFPARTFAGYLALLAARDAAAALDGWGEPGEAAAVFTPFLAALEAERGMEAAKVEMGLLAMSASASGLVEPKAAVEALDRLLAEHGKHAPTWAARGQVLAIAGDAEGAAESFEKAVEFDPGRPALRFDLGVALSRAGKPGRAAKVLETVKSDPHLGPAALAQLGLLKAAKGDIEEAETLLDAAVNRDPQRVEAWTALGRILVAKGSFDLAEVAFRRGAECPSPPPDLLLAWGCYLAEQDRFKEAADPLRRLLAFRPEDPAAHLHLGRAATAASQRDLALHHLRKALRAGGDTLPAVRQAVEDLSPVEREERLVRLLTESAGLAAEEQIRFLKGLLREESGFAEARVRLGIALVARGKVRRAIGQFERALKVAPEDPEAWSGLATALRARRRFAAAEAAHREALSRAPNHAPFHLNLADTLLRAGKVREAAAAVDVARRLDPRHPLLPGFVAAVKFALGGGTR
jgi:tetratricopeptide (TPR) repeat protein